jgi:hypothetical protein
MSPVKEGAGTYASKNGQQSERLTLLCNTKNRRNMFLSKQEPQVH